MDKTIVEKAQLRLYLKMQIRKIKQILELRRLQALCKIRILAKKVAPNFDIIFRLEGKSFNEQVNYLITLISGQVDMMLHDLRMWEGHSY